MSRLDSSLAISRRYLHDEAVERLRELILSGELPPRSRINEVELAERFDISRTPLREAIKILATEGLLDLLPRRGARVASLSTKEIEDTLEVVAALEATAGELSAKAMTEGEVEAVADLTRRMVAAWKAGDEAEYFRLNRQIHEAIMRASRNDVLDSVYLSLSGRIQRARYSAHKTAAQWQKAVEDHEEMLALLRARSGTRLGALMRRHVRSKKPVIEAAFGEETDA